MAGEEDEVVVLNALGLPKASGIKIDEVGGGGAFTGFDAGLITEENNTRVFFNLGGVT